MVQAPFEATPTSELLDLLRRARSELVVFEPERYEAQVCAVLAEELSGLAKACEVAAARAAVRAAACGVHRDQGFADGHEWVAKLQGTTTSTARELLRTVAEMEACPQTRDAVVAGEVSVQQAAEIVRAEREAPGAEHELLEAARGASLRVVRDQARKRRLDAIDREKLRARQHAAREVQHWIDDLGMVAGSFRLEPVAGARFVKRLERATDRRWRAARRDGQHESRPALAADAFCDLLAGDDTSDGGGSEATGDAMAMANATTAERPTPEGSTKSVGTSKRRRSVPVEVVIVQSAEVARRGHVHPGEVCHVVGGGPVAPSEVAELVAAGAFVKAVLHDGTQVTHVAHWGRHLSAAQQTAYGIGPPPEFDGVCCSEPGCKRRLGLEADHVDPLAHGGPTSLENLDPKCRVHHQAKTQRDRAAGLFDHGP